MRNEADNNIIIARYGNTSSLACTNQKDCNNVKLYLGDLVLTKLLNRECQTVAVITYDGVDGKFQLQDADGNSCTMPDYNSQYKGYRDEKIGTLLHNKEKWLHNDKYYGIPCDVAVKNERDDLLKTIQSMKDDSGREGCTYGDTEYDSVSVVYGYNLAIQNIIEVIKKMKKV